MSNPKNKSDGLKSWQEFLKLDDSYDVKMSKLRESMLGLVSPQDQRSL